MTAALPTDPKARKDAPMYRGLLKYFPRALAYVAEVSRIGNEQHNPGQEMHWAKEKSTDHGDCIVRHQCDAGGFDADNVRHSGKVAWRALAQLEIELEEAAEVEGDAERYQTLCDLDDPVPKEQADRWITGLRASSEQAKALYGRGVLCNHDAYAKRSALNGNVMCCGCGEVIGNAR